MVYIRPPELIHLTESLYPLTNFSPYRNTLPVISSPGKLASLPGFLVACVLRFSYGELALEKEIEEQVSKYWSKLSPSRDHI